MKSSIDGWMVEGKHRRRSGIHVHPIVKLQVAIKMREVLASEWQYTYLPKHCIYGEYCMVVASRSFRVVNCDTQRKKKSQIRRSGSKISCQTGEDLKVFENPIPSNKPQSSNQFIAREIAFGPDCAPNVKSAAIWFHIDDSDIAVCSSQQAKRYRMKKGTVSGNIEVKSKTQDSQALDVGVEQSVFDFPSKFDSFPMIHPQDPDAHELITDILKHRLSVLRAERISILKERFDLLKILEVKKAELRERFIHIQRSWVSWAWPINVGREKVNKDTLLPPVDVLYTMQTVNDEKQVHISPSVNVMQRNVLGGAVVKLWQSFMSTLSHRNVSVYHLQESGLF